MHSSESIRRKRHRRPRIRTIVVVSLLVGVIAEPVVMYRTLVHEKEQRRAAAELPTPAAPDRAQSLP